MNNDLGLQSSLAQNELKLFCTINNSKISLLDSKPRISWNAVENAISYLVVIMKDSKKYWQQEVKGLEIDRADIPPLQLGTLYTVIIKVNIATSSPEISDSKSFIILDRENVKILLEAERELDKFENLDEDTKTFAQTPLIEQTYMTAARSLSNQSLCAWIYHNISKTWCCSLDMCRNYPPCRE